MFDRSNRLPGMFEPSNPATRKPLKSNRKHDSLARTLCVPHNSFLLLMMLSYDFKLCRSHLRAVEKHLLNSLVWLLCLPRNDRWYSASLSHPPSPLRNHQYLTILFGAPRTQVLQYDSNRKQLHPKGILTVQIFAKKNST